MYKHRKQLSICELIESELLMNVNANINSHSSAAFGCHHVSHISHCTGYKMNIETWIPLTWIEMCLSMATIVHKRWYFLAQYITEFETQNKKHITRWNIHYCWGKICLWAKKTTQHEKKRFQNFQSTFECTTLTHSHQIIERLHLHAG